MLLKLLSVLTFSITFFFLFLIFLSGVYISRYADLLQPNPLETGATGDVIIFKVIKVNLCYLFMKAYVT